MNRDQSNTLPEEFFQYEDESRIVNDQEGIVRMVYPVTDRVFISDNEELNETTVEPLLPGR